ncbi:asparagine synthase (glutamine-hydrolyzing) [Alphaproteobacteria bacterium]|nr:asparagine synthase (glutamine-hydrolyzing) [Alphaproteobacteria bacterium]
MCGIAGILSEKFVSRQLVENMLSTISHRGPDGRFVFQSAGYIVGMTRLAINDLQGGMQPLSDESGRFFVMYNGEIYNSPELRKLLLGKGYNLKSDCDGEVIAHLFSEFGVESFSYLDGMFAIALWDEFSKKLYLVRDQSGEKPLYYSLQDHSKGICFGSEINCVRTALKFNPSLNLDAIWDLPTFLWVPEPQTIFNEIVALEKGGIIEFSVNSVRKTKMRKGLNINLPDLNSFNDKTSWVRNIVQNAVSSRLLSDVPVGSFLSGGLDSSIITALAASEIGPIDTFTVKFESGYDPIHGSLDESEEASHFARKLGCQNYQVAVSADSFLKLLDEFSWHSGEPFAVSSGLGILAVAGRAHELGHKVLLSGDCADEAFGGYSWYQYLNLQKEKSCHSSNIDPILSFNDICLNKGDRSQKIAEMGSHEQAYAWHYYAHELEKKALFNNDIFHACRSSLRHFVNFNEQKNWNPMMFIENDRDFYAPNEMLRKLDRMTMARSIEGRVPFASPSVAAMCQSLKFEELVTQQSLKGILRDAFAYLLPEEVINRKKHGFNVPIDQWLRNEWAGLVNETFSSTSALSKLGLLHKDAHLRAVKMVNDEKRLNGHTIFTYIMLNRWLENNFI